jgi:hypothetical protein
MLAGLTTFLRRTPHAPRGGARNHLVTIRSAKSGGTPERGEVTQWASAVKHAPPGVRDPPALSEPQMLHTESMSGWSRVSYDSDKNVSTASRTADSVKLGYFA